MRNMIPVLIAAMMAGNVAASGSYLPGTSNNSLADSTSSSTSDPSFEWEDEILGGFEHPDSPIITDEIKALCDKAFEGLCGASYEPVALLATQVVAGTNYCILFKCTPAILNPTETYAIGYLYEELEGNVECTDMIISSFPTDLINDAVSSDDISTDADNQNGNDTLTTDDNIRYEGAWEQPDSPEMTKEASDAFEKAFEELVGVAYDPLALLSTQVVAGTNYRILCEATVVVPDAEPKYVIVTINEDLDGNAEILDISNLEEDTDETEETDTADEADETGTAKETGKANEA